jgi:hypothetical protein
MRKSRDGFDEVGRIGIFADAHQLIPVSQTPEQVLLVQFTSLATLRMAEVGLTMSELTCPR